MDFGTIFGTLGGTALIIWAIMSGSEDGSKAFYDFASVLIVGGGTIAATAIAFPTSELKMIISVSRRVFNNPKTEMQDIVKFMVECAQAARKRGNLVLEEMAKHSPWAPIRKGLGLIADGTDAATLTEILSTELKNMEDRHRIGIKIFQERASTLPHSGWSARW